MTVERSASDPGPDQARSQAPVQAPSALAGPRADPSLADARLLHLLSEVRPDVAARPHGQGAVRPLRAPRASAADDLPPDRDGRPAPGPVVARRHRPGAVAALPTPAGRKEALPEQDRGPVRPQREGRPGLLVFPGLEAAGSLRRPPVGVHTGRPVRGAEGPDVLPGLVRTSVGASRVSCHAV